MLCLESSSLQVKAKKLVPVSTTFASCFKCFKHGEVTSEATLKKIYIDWQGHDENKLE
jgi:hypothetical protein